jgi:methionyl-tRNA formyltransferase
MRVVFLGTPDFAVPALQALLDHSYDVRGVFTQPDRPSGRGQKLQSSPIKILALKQGIPVFQPERIRDEANRTVLEDLRPDFIVTVAYGQILPGWVLRSAAIAPVNIHASLLPRYRGAAPIPWAILNGDAVTGVTTMIMEETLDSGPILLQEEIPIPPDKTAGELAGELSVLGARLLIRTLEGLQKGQIQPAVQDESKASWAPRITKEMGRISWDGRARDIHNRVRAMNPRPVAFTLFRGSPLQIWRSLAETHPSEAGEEPGTVLGVSGKGLRVQCADKTVLSILEAQMPGKSRVTGREFASGARLRPGDRIE